MPESSVTCSSCGQKHTVAIYPSINVSSNPELKEKGQTDLDVFVRMMNEKAASLGCRGSHFNNPSGLTDSDHYTTPYDMCLIMQAAIKNPVFRDIESHTYWKHAPIRRYPDADDPQNTVYMKHLMLRKNSSQSMQPSPSVSGKPPSVCRVQLS